MKKNILVTGGAGFIGSHLVRRFVNKYPEYQIINFDCLTYAGNLENLVDVETKENYQFVKGNICNFSELVSLFEKYRIHSVIHLAAESHVDRSISNPIDFVMTNVVGTVNLLNAYKQFGDVLSGRFYHVSTDEVYGSLGSEGKFTEETSYAPNSPYSASKASSDHFVRAYGETFKLPFLISNCSNNYGSHQFPEKLIPLMINNIKQNKPLPVYGTGSNVRDWLWVEDHAAAIDEIFHNGEIGNTYNVGGNNEWDNLSLVKKLCDIMDEKLSRPLGTSAQLIHFVTDRAGHDFRYAIDASKLESKLGWKPTINFDEGFKSTIDWYLKNEDWLAKVTSGTYQDYYLNMYSKEKL